MGALNGIYGIAQKCQNSLTSFSNAPINFQVHLSQEKVNVKAKSQSEGS